MSSNPGNMQVNLGLNQAPFSQGMQQATKQVQGFNSNVKNMNLATDTFNAHILSSRAVMGTFAETLGVSAHKLHHLSEAFLAGGPIVGAAVLGLTAINSLLESQSEAAKKAAESTKQYHEAWDKLQNAKNQKEFDTQRGGMESKIRNDRFDLDQNKNSQQMWSNLGHISPLAQLYGGYLKISNWMNGDDMHREELNSAENRLRLRRDGFKGENEGGASRSVEHSVSAGQLDVFRVEHTTEVDLLRQIAQNTSALQNLGSGGGGIGHPLSQIVPKNPLGTGKFSNWHSSGSVPSSGHGGRAF